jgi:hypothetical protein
MFRGGSESVMKATVEPFLRYNYIDTDYKYLLDERKKTTEASSRGTESQFFLEERWGFLKNKRQRSR